MFGGKAVTLRSADPNNPAVLAATIVDAQGASGAPRRAFWFHNGEGPATVLAGLTIRNGHESGGGAIRRENGSNPTIRDCVLRDNTSTWNGGALACTGGAAPHVLRCTFQQNTAVHGGGADVYQSAPQFVRCTFSGNHADGSGGGLWQNTFSSATATDCVFTGNSGNWAGGGAACQSQCAARFTRCTFTGNVGGSSGGIWNNSYCNSAIQDCTFTDNTGNYNAGGVGAEDHSSPAIIRCAFVGNHTTYGGAIFAGGQSAPVIYNCRMFDNVASGDGGAVNTNDGQPELRNCLIAGNRALYGVGGAFAMCCNSAVTLAGVTVVANHAPTGGGASADGSALNVHNSIVWGNSDNAGSGENSQLRRNNATASVNYSCIQGWSGALGGAGNHGADPQFADADGADDDPNTWQGNNYHLAFGSPSIDTGDPAYSPLLDETDLDGQLRVRPWAVGGAARIDQGAYESNRLDLNADGQVDAQDLSLLLACMSGPDQVVAPGCGARSLDVDLDIDLIDYAVLQRALTSP